MCASIAFADSCCNVFWQDVKAPVRAETFSSTSSRPNVHSKAAGRLLENKEVYIADRL
jgi:hypothetical protein